MEGRGGREGMDVIDLCGGGVDEASSSVEESWGVVDLCEEDGDGGGDWNGPNGNVNGPRNSNNSIGNTTTSHDQCLPDRYYWYWPNGNVNGTPNSNNSIDNTTTSQQPILKKRQYPPSPPPGWTMFDDRRIQSFLSRPGNPVTAATVSELAGTLGRTVGEVRGRMRTLEGERRKGGKGGRRRNGGGGGGNTTLGNPSSSSSSLASLLSLQPPLLSAPAAPSTLNALQRLCYSAAVCRVPLNIFLTGSAGTGKSFLLREVIEALVKCHGEDAVAVTAPTGVAATNLPRGVTLHSWSGIGLGTGRVEKLTQTIRKNSEKCQRWQTCKVLVIDEISMLSAELLTKLDKIGRAIRGDRDSPSLKLPFGGIQVLLSGDFFQLPPVTGRMAFESPTWSDLRLYPVVLRDVVRQCSDPEYARVLDAFRSGTMDEKQRGVIRGMYGDRRGPFPDDGIEPTRLYCVNRDVNEENGRRLRGLGGEAVEFRAEVREKNVVESGGVRETLEKALEGKIPEVLELKVGAQVMCMKNYPSEGLVNGSRGVVTAFRGGNKPKPVVKWTGGKEEVFDHRESFHQSGAGGKGKGKGKGKGRGRGRPSITRIQIPLKLAWSLSVHKSQGMTLDRAEICLEEAFEWGQEYVALSRVRGREGCKLIGSGVVGVGREGKGGKGGKVRAFYERLEGSAGSVEDRNVIDGVIDQSRNKCRTCGFLNGTAMTQCDRCGWAMTGPTTTTGEEEKPKKKAKKDNDHDDDKVEKNRLAKCNSCSYSNPVSNAFCENCYEDL